MLYYYLCQINCDLRGIPLTYDLYFEMLYQTSLPYDSVIPHHSSYLLVIASSLSTSF